jgi:hypothetical protein
MNPLGVVSMVEVPNNPRLLSGGVSELYDLTDIQDRINKTLFDRMQTQEFGVDPQKWAKAFPTRTTTATRTSSSSAGTGWSPPNIAETAFGNFAVAPLAPYSEAKREDVKDIASRSHAGPVPARRDVERERRDAEGVRVGSDLEGRSVVARGARRPRKRCASPGRWLASRWQRCPHGDDLDEPGVPHRGRADRRGRQALQSGISSLRQAREDVGYTATQIAQLEKDDQAAAVDPVMQQILKDVAGVNPDAAAGA